MNIHRILIGFSVLLACILIVLVSFLVFRRQKLLSLQNTAISDNQGKVALSQTEQEQLQQFAEKNPNAAVEGIRSPTPVPLDTLTITTNGAEPPHLNLQSTDVTVINRLKRNLYIFRKNITDGKIDQLGSVSANGQVSVSVMPEEQLVNPQFILLISNTAENPENAPPVLQVPLELTQ